MSSRIPLAEEAFDPNDYDEENYDLAELGFAELDFDDEWSEEYDHYLPDEEEEEIAACV